MRGLVFSVRIFFLYCLLHFKSFICLRFSHNDYYCRFFLLVIIVTESMVKPCCDYIIDSVFYVLVTLNWMWKIFHVIVIYFRSSCLFYSVLFYFFTLLYSCSRFSHAPKHKIFELISVLLLMMYHTMAVYSNGHRTTIILNHAL